MKKFIAIILSVMLIVSVAVPVCAVTPPLSVPNMPEIPDISDDVNIELPDGVFDDYIPGNGQPEEPTEPPADVPTRPNWCDFVKVWIDLWANAFHKHYG